MATATVGELLDRGRECETRIMEYYEAIRNRSLDNDVRLLTYSLVRHRRQQAKALAGMPVDRLRPLSEVEPRFDGPGDPTEGFRVPAFAPETVRGEELIGAAVNYDGAWVALYRSILAQPIEDDVRAILESLLRMEERDIALLKKILSLHYF